MRSSVPLAAASLCLVMGSRALAGELAAGPEVRGTDAGLRVAFTVSGRTDVEVAVLNAAGEVVRHLAAGVLGGEKAPPAPLKPGPGQECVWDGRDDFGKRAGGGPFRVRVRTGLGARFSRFLGGDDPYSFGEIVSLAVDEGGSLYAVGFRGTLNLDCMTLRKFDPEGRYLRTIMPFPADLPPGAMKDLARWSERREAFLPCCLRTINPAFYPGISGRGGSALRLVSASAKTGLLLTNGETLYRLDPRGAVPGEQFAVRDLWPEDGRIKNSGHGPVSMAASPDGKVLYLCGPFSSKTRYGHKYDRRFPPGRIYRMPLDGTGRMAEFVTIDVAHDEGQGGAWFKELGLIRPGYWEYRPRGPLHGLAVGPAGRVYVADREHHRIVAFTPAGKEVGCVPVQCPDQIALHPRTGVLYVLQRARVQPRAWMVRLVRFDRLGEGVQPSASYDLSGPGGVVQMALSADEKGTTIWLSGTGKARLLALADRGDAFEPVGTHFTPRPDPMATWTRLAVDYARDEVYCNDGAVDTRRYEGETGECTRLVKDGKPVHVADLAVGPDGLLYARLYVGEHRPGGGFSGPLWRLNRDLSPAPYAQTGTHVLSGYIYGRYGHGYADRGIGVGPDGTVFVSWMYRWAKYWLTAFGPDGRPAGGSYMTGMVDPAHVDKGMPKSLNSAVIGPLPAGNGGVRVDLKGNVYVGLWAWPEGVAVPAEYRTDSAFLCGTGSVFRFSPGGGLLASQRWGGMERVQRTPDAAGIEVRSGARERVRPPKYEPNVYRGFVQGATAAYPGLAPFSHASYGSNTCCVCRSPRFDVDRYGRLYVPNAFTQSVRVFDNAGNLICEIGRYGNFDSRYVNPNLPAGRAGRPTVAAPGIPLAWPTAAGVSEGHLYVCDAYNHRAVRAKLTYAAAKVATAK